MEPGGKKMPSGYQRKTTFFEVFKTRCSESDLGPISLNWFEELTLEAPPYNYEILEDHGNKTEIIELNSFKTPQRKPVTYNQLASTPLIFKEQNVNFSLYSSPLRGPDHCKLDIGKDNAVDKELRKSNCIMKTKLGQANDVTSPPLSACLTESPMVLRGPYRTPQRKKPVVYGNLFYTPKLMKVNTPEHISESLGAEVDPDMSWSSSLATPPTLSSTVLIVRDGQTSGARILNDTTIMLQKSLSQHGESPKRLDRTISSVPNVENTHAEDYVTSQELGKMIDHSFGDRNSFEDHGGKMMRNMPNVVEDEVCDPVIDTPGEDDASFSFPGYKMGSLRKVKLDKTRKKYFKIKTNECEETEKLNKKDKYLSTSETELEYPSNSNITKIEIQKPIENVNEELLKDDVPSLATQWSQLNLSGLDVTQIEKTPLPHISFCDQDTGERSANSDNECSNLTTFKNVEISAYKQDEEIIITPQKETVLLLKQTSPEISPQNSLSQDRKSSMFKMGQTSEEPINMNGSSFCTINTNIPTESTILGNKLENPKSSVNDIVCPKECDSLSPNTDGKGNCQTITKCSSSPLYSTGIISHLKKKTKKFIYVVNDDSSCEGEKIQKAQEIRSKNCSASSHLDSSEVHPEFTNAVSDVLDSSVKRKCLQFNPEKQTVSLIGCDKTMLEECFNESSSPQNEVTHQDIDFKEVKINRSDLESPVTEDGNQSQSQKRGYSNASKSPGVSSIKERVLAAACLLPRKHAEIELGNIGQNSHFPTKKRTLKDPISSIINTSTQLSHDSPEFSVMICGEKEPLYKMKQKLRFRRNSDSSFITNNVSSETAESFTNSHFKKNQETEVLNDSSGEAQQTSEKCNKVSVSLEAHVNKNADIFVNLGDQEKTLLITEETALKPYPEEHLSVNKDNFLLQTIEKKNVQIMDRSEELLETHFCYLGESVPENSTEIDSKQTVQELCTEDFFLSGVVPEFSENSQNKNQAPKFTYECTSLCKNFYSKSTIDTNVKSKKNEGSYLGAWAGNFNPDSNKNFGSGFKTASNKEIILSEYNIKKGKLFFRDIEQHYNSYSSVEIVNASTSVAAESIKADLDIKNSFPAWNSEASHTISKDVQSNIFVINKKDTDVTPEDLPKKDLDLSHSLTASQKAEITELSTILEETGSQFEFTQFRKQSPTVQTLEISTNKAADELGNLNAYEVQNTVELDGYFGAKNEIDNNSATEQIDLIVNSEVVINIKQETVGLPKSNSGQVTFTDSFTKNEVEFKGFCSALGRKMNVSNEALQKAMKLFSDIEEIGEEMPLQNFRNGSLDGNHKSNDVATLNIASYNSNNEDFKEKDAKCVHKPQNNIENNTDILVEENILNCSRDPENKKSSCPLSISSHKNKSKLKGSVVPKSSNNCQREINGLSLIGQQNIHLKMSNQFIKQENYQSKEELLDLTCLGEAVKDEEMFILNISQMEQLVSNQKEQKIRENENAYDLQHFQTASGRNIIVSKESFNKVAHLFAEECSVKELNNFSFPLILKMSDVACNKRVESSGKEEKNLFESETEEMALGATKNQLISIQQGPKIENKKSKEHSMEGFHTASGKKVIISKESLAKVKHFFVEENLENDITNMKNLKTELFKEREKVNEKHGQAYEMVELNNAQVWEEMQSYQADDEKVLVSVTTAGLPEITDSAPSNELSNSVLFEEKLSGNKINCISSDTKQFAGLPVEISGLGFYTGHGKSISVSETSLLAARKWIRERDLEDLGENISYVDGTIYLKADSDVHMEKLVPLNTSNNTSSVKDKNCISDKQDSGNLNNMSNIKHNLKHYTKRSDFHHSDNADVFQEHLSDKGMSCVKAKLPAFITASGKTVSVSNEAVQKAREVFANDCDKIFKPNIETKSENDEMDIVKDFSKTLENKEDISLKSFDGKKENMSTTDISILNKKYSKLAQLENMSKNTGLEMNSELSNSKTSDFHKSTMGRLPKGSSSVGIFCTANGKPVQVSDNSLKKARQVFSEIENNSEQLLSMTSYKDSESYPVTLIEESAMLHAKTNLSEKKDYLSNRLNLHSNCGFSTASGKQVLISENAFKKAKRMLAEFDLMKSECCIEHLPESAQNVIPKTLSPICIDGGKNLKHTANSKNEETCNKQLNFSNNYVKINSSENRSTTKVNCDQFKQDEMQASLETKLSSAKDSSLLKKEQVGLKNVNMEDDEILYDLPVKRSLQVSSPHSKAPENSLEREAMEIAKAFMQDDELIESELPHNAKQSFFTYKNKEHMQLNSRFGKRRMEKHALHGEPPIKRKLLHEFDRVVENQEKSLKPSKSSPDGTMKDRRMFMHHIPLKPVICDPFSTTKEWQEMWHPNFTAPDQGFISKSPILKHRPLENSSYKSLLGSPLYKVSSADNGKLKPVTIVGKPAKVFVPPFKTKSNSLTDEECVSKRLKLKVKEHTQENEKQKCVEEPDTRDSENNENYLTDKDNSSRATADVFEEYGDSNREMTENLQNAREMQDMRIKKKQTQQIHPQPGSLYLKKTSTVSRISLKVAVEGRVPATYSSKQLYMCGVSKQCLRINSKNAESFKFHSQDYFSKEYLLDGKGIQLADGGWLIPTDEGKLGKEEFYRALCDTPGVDPKLITKIWVYNHYRWIIWKLAAMEFAFPKEFASRCLTPERVLLQLKYRYDIEIDKSRRSAIKKIMERDETAAKTLVLCVSEIISSGTNMSTTANSKNSNVDTKQESAVIEVTDGWYAIKALLDTPLLVLLHRGKLTVGQKIITHGAELIGSQEACTPLEAPESLMLKLSANSTRPARWYAKLGFFSDPRPFPLPLSSLFGEGGNVGCVDIVIQRVYPAQWMEKTASGLYIFRNERAEEKEALKHEECQQKQLEALLTKIQAEFEKHEENSARRHGLSRILTRHQVRALQDGADLYEAVKSAPDPAYIEGCFSKEQLSALNNHRQMLNDKKQAQLQSEFRKAVAAAELEEPGLFKRDVTAIWKLRIVSYEKQEDSVILSIWRPLSDIYSLLKEGNRYRIYHLASSPSKSKSDRARVQLTATKKTQYQQLPVSHETLFQVYQPREALPFIKLADPSFQPPCAEVDVVGLVVLITKKPGVAPLVYLSDEHYNLLAVKFWIDLNEDVIKLHTPIAASNLQWRAESRPGIPTLFAGEFSLFSASPKESHFQETFNKLKSSVENIDLFCNDAQDKLTHLLNTYNSKQPNAIREYNLDSPSPQARLGLGHVISTSHSEPSNHCPEGNSGLTTSSVKITPTSDYKGDRKMDDPRICKKRRSLDFFSRLPLPPPISPVCTFVSPAAQKAFQPPRSCGKNYSKPTKKNTLNSPQVTPLKALSGTSMVENDLIADEELALINTQALLSNSSE